MANKRFKFISKYNYGYKRIQKEMEVEFEMPSHYKASMIDSSHIKKAFIDSGKYPDVEDYRVNMQDHCTEIIEL